MDHSRGDSGSIVLGWLTKLALSLSLVGIVAFDGISLMSTKFTAADRAGAAARAASEVCMSSKGDVQKAYDAAYAFAAENGDTVLAEGFSCAAGGVVSLTYSRQAATLIMERIGPLKEHTTVTATGSARQA